MARPNNKVVTLLSAATNTATGTVADALETAVGGTFQLVTGGTPTAGAVTFLGSIDGVTYTPLTGATLVGQTGSPTLTNGVLTMTAATQALVSLGTSNSAIRFFRADVTTNMTGGTVSVKVAWF